MAVGLGEEFHAAGLIEFLQQLDDLGGVLLQQFDGAAADGEGDLEGFAIGLGHLEEGLESRDVRTFCGFCDAALVLVVVEIVVVLTDLEEAIALEMYILVNLEI